MFWNTYTKICGSKKNVKGEKSDTGKYRKIT